MIFLKNKEEKKRTVNLEFYSQSNVFPKELSIYCRKAYSIRIVEGSSSGRKFIIPMVIRIYRNK